MAETALIFQDIHSSIFMTTMCSDRDDFLRVKTTPVVSDREGDRHRISDHKKIENEKGGASPFQGGHHAEL